MFNDLCQQSVEMQKNKVTVSVLKRTRGGLMVLCETVCVCERERERAAKVYMDTSRTRYHTHALIYMYRADLTTNLGKRQIIGVMRRTNQNSALVEANCMTQSVSCSFWRVSMAV